jgi:RNA polymerase sigma factor (sigma-70 family)
MQDFELLRDYAQNASHEAFAQVVQRHIGLVYSAALRQVGDIHRAQDVTQAVFLLLSRKAGSIGPKVILGGWLLQATSYTAKNLLRSEARRKRHEHKAAQMTPTHHTPDDEDQAWPQMAPILDQAIRKLPTASRDALVLRYFEGKTPDEVAQRLGISPEAARQRVSRAIEGLRGYFARNGIALPAALIGTSLARNATSAAPSAITTQAANLACQSASTLSLSKGVTLMMTLAKFKSLAACIGALAAALAIVVVLSQVELNPKARAQGAAQPPANAPEAGIIGIVLDVDGKPLANAQVLLADRNHPVTIYGDTLPQEASLMMSDINLPLSTRYARKQANLVQMITGANGEFSFKCSSCHENKGAAQQPIQPKPLPRPPAGATTTPPVGKDFMPESYPQIVVRAEEGFAQVFVDQMPQDRKIQVRAWARIEGTMQIGDRALRNEKIYLSNWPRLNNNAIFAVLNEQIVRTDADGHFAFPRVTPGDLWITHRLRDMVAQPSHFAYVDVQPGKTHDVQLGGTGRPVVGQLVQPKEAKHPLLWMDQTHWSEGTAEVLPAHRWPQIPPGLTPGQQDAELAKWGNTDEGRSAKRNLFKITFLVNPDGTFRIEDLRPGQYHLAITTTLGPDVSETLATLDYDLTVPEMAGARNDEPLDVGPLEVTLKPRLYAGDPAPAFECKTFDGQAVKLENFKGKHLLLYFWDAGFPKEALSLHELRSIREQYPQERLAIVGLSVGNDPQRARQFAKDNDLPGLQCDVGPAAQVFKDYHAVPDLIFLIAPDGKLLAQHLAHQTLLQTVAKELTTP